MDCTGAASHPSSAHSPRAVAGCRKIHASDTMQVTLHPVEAMQRMATMLRAVGACSKPDVRASALKAAVPHACHILATPEAHAQIDDSVRDDFKLYTLALLTVCVEESPHAEKLLTAARHAFCCRPYWFVMALTDALERQDHPALAGAVQFGRELVNGPCPPEQTFLVRTCSRLNYLCSASDHQRALDALLQRRLTP
jgi:hypothetical protein